MKISSANSIKKDFPSPFKVKRKPQSFSSEFQFANHREKKQHLKKLLDKINKKGQQVIQSNSINAIEEYKLMIKEYLSYILETGYNIKQVQSPWNGMGSMTIVEVLDQELDKLSSLVLEEQKDTFAIINMVDCISGILLNIYR